MLDREQLDRWKRDGFLVLPDFVPREECDSLRIHVGRLLDDIDPASRAKLEQVLRESRGEP